jgi:hypothetical protein
MTILIFTGANALSMATLTNRLPEINNGPGWKTARSQSEARRILEAAPVAIRLRVGDRVLLEGILGHSIPVGSVLADWIAGIDTSTLSQEQQAALTIFKEFTA